MFIRDTPARSNATGEHYFIYRLVESVRVWDKVKQVVLHNLGRHFPIDKAYWRPLAQRIEELLAAQAVLAPLDLPPLVEREAQRIAALLRARQGAKPTPKGSDASPEPAVEAAAPKADIQAVDVESLELLRPRSVGVEHLGLWAMHPVGFVHLLKELGLSDPQRMAIVGAIIGRMAEPGLVVMDADIASEANLTWLRERGYRYPPRDSHFPESSRSLGSNASASRSASTRRPSRSTGFTSTGTRCRCPGRKECLCPTPRGRGRGHPPPSALG